MFLRHLSEFHTRVSNKDKYSSLRHLHVKYYRLLYEFFPLFRGTDIVTFCGSFKKGNNYFFYFAKGKFLQKPPSFSYQVILVQKWSN